MAVNALLFEDKCACVRHFFFLFVSCRAKEMKAALTGPYLIGLISEVVVRIDVCGLGCSQ